jgi:hypothetical protein
MSAVAKSRKTGRKRTTQSPDYEEPTIPFRFITEPKPQPVTESVPDLTSDGESHLDSQPQATPDPPAGLRCSGCNCADLRVWRTTKMRNGKIRRERFCRHCERPMITYEQEAFNSDQLPPKPLQK